MTFIVLLFLHRWLILSCLAQSIPVCLKHLSRTVLTRSSMWSVLCTFSPVYVLLCFMTTCLGCWYVKWYNTLLGKIWNWSGSTCIASCLMKPCFCTLKTGEVFRHFHSYQKCTGSIPEASIVDISEFQTHSIQCLAIHLGHFTVVGKVLFATFRLYSDKPSSSNWENGTHSIDIIITRHTVVVPMVSGLEGFQSITIHMWTCKLCLMQLTSFFLSWSLKVVSDGVLWYWCIPTTSSYYWAWLHLQGGTVVVAFSHCTIFCLHRTSHNL